MESTTIPNVEVEATPAVAAADAPSTLTKKTIILFSGDFDKVMAALIIANGAAAMGDDVTIFCTFWGLNILRKPEKVAAASGGKAKTTLQAMFGRMMPKGTRKLGLSKMNFAGAGAPLMRKVMKSQNAMTLEELFDSAVEQGVKFVACTLSMDILGFKEEELIDGVEFAGVAAYLGEADEANVNLFI
jgi:peroxiredoxin family protein